MIFLSIFKDPIFRKPQQKSPLASIEKQIEEYTILYIPQKS